MPTPINPQDRTQGASAIEVLLLPNDVLVTSIASAPVNGVSGTYANQAGPGSMLLRTNGTIYSNTGTKASPTWTALATA